MKKRPLKEKYSRTLLQFKRRPQSVSTPKIPVVLKSPVNAYTTKYSKRFLLDTGASISILGRQYKSFIKHLTQKDELPVKYGAGASKMLPIFDVIFIINGREIPSTIAYDERSDFLLLGQHNFFENFDYTLFDYHLKESRLY